VQYHRKYGSTAIQQVGVRRHLAHSRTRARKTGFASPYPFCVTPLNLRDGWGGLL